MKKRPVLTVVADDDVDGEGLLRPPQLTIKAVGRRRVHDVKGTSDDEDEDGGLGEDPDALENSCDIGETSLKKGPLHINRMGVTFLPIDETSDTSDVARPKSSGSRPGSSSFKSLSASPPRCRHTKQIPLDELQTCGLIGRGCSGHVMKAKHTTTEQLYALKLVNNVYDKSKRDQMLTEIRTLYSVDSAYLVGFYGAYFSDHQLSLVLEFCAAGSLDKVISQRAPIPEHIVACMAFQMLHGLRDLKKTNHFHRDIKPQNILLQTDGRVKLTDFGIARELGHSQDMAQTFVGTFKYMSPERVQNDPYDYKSDIWSMGLVLIELATKMFPFRNARSYIDVVQSIIECTEPSLPMNTPELKFSTALREFIGHCVRKDPKQRGSVDELLASAWLQHHRATDGERCASRVMRWFNGHDDDPDAKSRDDEEEEEEIEEDIVAEDAK